MKKLLLAAAVERLSWVVMATDVVTAKGAGEAARKVLYWVDAMHLGYNPTTPHCAGLRISWCSLSGRRAEVCRGQTPAWSA